MTMTLKGVVHGKTIELERESGLPDGQGVSVAIQKIVEPPPKSNAAQIPPVETWCDRLVYDSKVLEGERIVKGTRLAAEALVTELETGKTDEQMLRAYPELTKADLEALRNYALAPVAMRKSFGGWAEEAEELDKFLEWRRQKRKLKRRAIEP